MQSEFRRRCMRQLNADADAGVDAVGDGGAARRTVDLREMEKKS